MAPVEAGNERAVSIEPPLAGWPIWPMWLSDITGARC
jgi:hypothetical protein